MVKMDGVLKSPNKGLPPFDTKSLQRFCRLKIEAIKEFGVEENTPDGPYWFQDNGANVLAVVHADTVNKAHHFSVLRMSQDTEVYCPTLDDRLGMYTILDYLPKLGIKVDVLITTGEEKMRSTARYFVPPKGRRYNWIFSFDRKGTDAVMYDYYDVHMDKLLQSFGYKVGVGSYSDIAEMEGLRCKAFNFGIGYYNEHSLKAYVSRNDFYLNLKRFVSFFKLNSGKYFKHIPRYNIYTPEDGFGYIYKAGFDVYQDTFTDSEIELIESLEDSGYEFGGRVNKESLQSLVRTYNESKLKGSEDNPEYLNQEETGAQYDLFDDLSAIEANNVEVFSGTPPKEMNKYSKKIEKVHVLSLGDIEMSRKTEDSDNEAVVSVEEIKPVIVAHIARVDTDALSSHEERTIISEEAAKIRESWPPIKEIPEDDLGGVIHIIPLREIKEASEEYEYKKDSQTGRWNWHKTKPAHNRTTASLVL